MKVSIPISGFDPTVVLGYQDETLKKIQHKYNIIVTMRDECIHLKGDEKRVKEAAKAIKKMLAEKKPCVVDFRVEREENVWPMVPAGKSIDEMDGLDILESMA